MKRFHFFLLIGILLLSCHPELDLNPDRSIDLSLEWECAQPKQVGLDKKILKDAADQAGEFPRFLSLLVVKNGYLVLEEYFNENHQDSLNDVRSITKSVLSTLATIALQEGFISSLEDSIGPYLHPNIVALSPEKQGIRIIDLLTMTGGFEWDEWTNSSYNDWITSDDHLQYMADLNLISTPGNQFVYNTGSTHILGVVLEQAVGMKLEQFADQYLFNKIGISPVRWEILSDDYPNGGSGIDLRPRDLARLGQLYLQNGQSGSQQILDSDWVEEATQPFTNLGSNYGPLINQRYGYLWWRVNVLNYDAFLAWGYGGQFILVIPEEQMVVVSTTNWRWLSQEPGGSGAFTLEVLNILINELLPAIES